MFVNYHIARTPDLPPIGPYLYEYVLAGNGLFVRAERPGLQALIPLTSQPGPSVRGLADVQPYVHIDQRIPAELIGEILRISQATMPAEALFYLLPNPWRLYVPEQQAGPGSVQPTNPFHTAGQAALCEVHSHGGLAPYFSGADNRDETGFRLYGVIGRVDRDPAIRFRVGIYGHTHEVPADWVADLPVTVIDEQRREAAMLDEIEASLEPGAWLKGYPLTGVEEFIDWPDPAAFDQDQ